MNILVEGNTNFYATTTCWTSTINRSSVNSKSSSISDTSWSTVTNPGNSTRITIFATTCGANVCHESTAATESRATEFHNEQQRVGKRGGVVCIYAAERAKARYAVPRNYRNR